MPRDSSGNWVLYAGNPVTTGTTIASAWWNGTYNDLGSSIADSLDRTGATGGMTGQLKLYTVGSGPSLPAATFDSEPTTGLYWEATGDMRVAVQGVPYSKWTSAGFQESFDGGTTWKTPLYNNNGNQTFTGGLDFTAGSLTIGGKPVQAKLTSSTSCGTYSTSSTSFGTGITNLTITFTATGGPVLVQLVPDDTSNPALLQVANTNTSNLQVGGVIAISIDGGSTFFGQTSFGNFSTNLSGTVNAAFTTEFPMAYSAWTAPSAGSVTVKAYAKCIAPGAGTTTVIVANAKLFIMQL